MRTMETRHQEMAVWVGIRASLDAAKVSYLASSIRTRQCLTGPPDTRRPSIKNTSAAFGGRPDIQVQTQFGMAKSNAYDEDSLSKEEQDLADDIFAERQGLGLSSKKTDSSLSKYIDALSLANTGKAVVGLGIATASTIAALRFMVQSPTGQRVLQSAFDDTLCVLCTKEKLMSFFGENEKMTADLNKQHAKEIKKLKKSHLKVVKKQDEKTGKIVERAATAEDAAAQLQAALKELQVVDETSARQYQSRLEELKNTKAPASENPEVHAFMDRIVGMGMIGDDTRLYSQRRADPMQYILEMVSALKKSKLLLGKLYNNMDLMTADNNDFTRFLSVANTSASGSTKSYEFDVSGEHYELVGAGEARQEKYRQTQADIDTIIHGTRMIGNVWGTETVNQPPTSREHAARSAQQDSKSSSFSSHATVAPPQPSRKRALIFQESFADEKDAHIRNEGNLSIPFLQPSQMKTKTQPQLAQFLMRKPNAQPRHLSFTKSQGLELPPGQGRFGAVFSTVGEDGDELMGVQQQA